MHSDEWRVSTYYYWFAFTIGVAVEWEDGGQYSGVKAVQLALSLCWAPHRCGPKPVSLCPLVTVWGCEGLEIVANCCLLASGRPASHPLLGQSKQWAGLAVTGAALSKPSLHACRRSGPDGPQTVHKPAKQLCITQQQKKLEGRVCVWGRGGGTTHLHWKLK